MLERKPSAAAQPAEVIRFEGVDKAFGSNVIYEGLDLSVRKGEVLTILGGSGTGKSVMLKMMLGLIPWDAGRVTVLGTDITGLDDAQLLPVRRRIAMVFQNSALFDSLTVFENLAYPLVERGIKDEAELQRRVTEVLAMIDLPGTEDMLPADLSGGMRKRVGLARAVIQSPEVLLFDEPTTGLDPINVRRIDELPRHSRPGRRRRQRTGVHRLWR
jgi:phospholipid/cholesterol/gamma-HCH transport system ATP-binding protein